MYEGELYQKSFEEPLLLCVSQANIQKVLYEVQTGWCGSHIGGRSLVTKITNKGPGTYELEEMDSKPVPQTWHASKLSKFYC
ncbi:hypothetical protein LIER_15302 [Lithospermum erythrorhizon]|uniref:Uncharacterized protein n=1 Tax=Lithospermum erythrorhizon TaxID=34254 RepID=A0AAV3Q2Q7_LITER